VPAKSSERPVPLTDGTSAVLAAATSGRFPKLVMLASVVSRFARPSAIGEVIQANVP
jgi:hypothetical protein